MYKYIQKIAKAFCHLFCGS